MPQGPLTILIVNEHAEEVKLVAISVRGFFPDVRIDIAYSVQEAAVIAFEKVDQFQPGSNFSAWMAEIVRRCALNYRRKVQHRRTFAADPTILAEAHGGDSKAEAPWPITNESGELAPDQLAGLRPTIDSGTYRMPLDGLYLCGAGTHPGGFATGASGRLAVRQMLKDVRR